MNYVIDNYNRKTVRSGGRDIGEKVAEYFNIPTTDKGVCSVCGTKEQYQQRGVERG